MNPNKPTPQGAAPAPQAGSTAGTHPTPGKLLRLPAVEDRTGLRKSSVYAGMAAGTFPACVRLGARAVAWHEASIDRWIAERTTKAKP